jgi:hypothetical protein
MSLPSFLFYYALRSIDHPSKPISQDPFWKIRADLRACTLAGAYCSPCGKPRSKCGNGYKFPSVTRRTKEIFEWKAPSSSSPAS